MTIQRRAFLRLAMGVIALPTASCVARAQTYPARPMRILVGFPAGGPGDILARLVGQSLQQQLGQPVIVENRPGAGSNVAAEAVVQAPADGYTLLLVSSANAINATLYENLKFNFIRDVAPVAGISSEPNILVVNPSVPVKSVPELIAFAKANPRKLNMASAGNGTPPHVTGELFKMMTSVEMVHVPYRGGAPAVTDLIAGQVQVYFGTSSASVEHVKTGRLRALAVTSATRSDASPDLPTVGEFVPGFEANTWFGLGAPKNTPIEIVDRLNKEISASLADSKVRARLADLGGKPLTLSPADFGKLIAEETEKWGKVIRKANIKVG